MFLEDGRTSGVGSSGPAAHPDERLCRDKEQGHGPPGMTTNVPMATLWSSEETQYTW
ncbi:unnamed protein product [Cuscuta epithymum]|uniref:Uncharacterized protein n=1 Tax=Cuscuta epithymum TaxID=186058 RepID=A0AAV0EC68_9ASTE|nr:unnamed protein product [Cuscuta epithymum]